MSKSPYDDRLVPNVNREFTYRRLQSSQQAGGREIRLINILPGDAQETIRCRMRRVNLEDEVSQFDCLSYRWGEANYKTQKKIYVNGHAFIVEESLFQFLHKARDIKLSHSLWVDAICINQNDDEEKSTHVGWMGEVYRSARRVIIWLGPLSRHSNTVKLVSKMWEFSSSRMLESPEGLYRTPRGQGWNSLDGIIPQNGLHGAAHISLMLGINLVAREIIDNPYWNRTWIVQELVLARSAQILYDNKFVPWTIFQRGLLDITAPLASVLKAGKLFNTSSIDLRASQLEAVAYNDISDLLCDFRKRKSKDPRDRIYGLLGLLGDVEFPVNYESSYSLPVVTLDVIDYLHPLFRYSQEQTHGIPSPAAFSTKADNVFDGMGFRPYEVCYPCFVESQPYTYRALRTISDTATSHSACQCQSNTSIFVWTVTIPSRVPKRCITDSQTCGDRAEIFACELETTITTRRLSPTNLLVRFEHPRGARKVHAVKKYFPLAFPNSDRRR